MIATWPAMQQEGDRPLDHPWAVRDEGRALDVIDPDVVVLGGGMSNVQRLYDSVPGIWGRYIFSDHVATRLVRAMHGDASGVRGAAWLWGGPPRPQ